jgi:23S rRNA (cytosine1962-C5)-methyltransferase
LNVVRVNRKGAARVESGHPWIFTSDVIGRDGVQPGEAVQVDDEKGRSLGTALFSSTSQITLRFLSRSRVVPDREFIRGRIERALAFRSRVVSDSECARLVYSEADLLPGLIVDRYGDHLVVQILNQGMDRLQADVVSCLVDLLRPKSIVARNDVAVRKHESLLLEVKALYGEPPERVRAAMNHLRWHVDLLHGQKTGVYLDQRENYLAAARYARGHALDCFTSTGGFALHLAPRCESVVAVDSSSAALETARANAKTNTITNIQWKQADVFDLLTGYAQARRSFQIVVLDPPAFTKSRDGLEGAARGYKEINLRALKILETGGILATCSCSHHFSEASLLETVASAALDTRRTLRVLERRTQAQDHPILLTVAETHYLKCLIFEVL